MGDDLTAMLARQQIRERVERASTARRTRSATPRSRGRLSGRPAPR